MEEAQRNLLRHSVPERLIHIMIRISKTSIQKRAPLIILVLENSDLKSNHPHTSTKQLED